MRNGDGVGARMTQKRGEACEIEMKGKGGSGSPLVNHKAALSY